jgi:hypothetical protein
MCEVDRPLITRQVLSYLTEHTGAQDTLEGIVEWWLLEQRIIHQTQEVDRVLADLTARKLLVQVKAADGRVHYRANRRRAKAIREMLRSDND